MVIIIFIFKSANKSVDKSILNGRGTYNIYKTNYILNIKILVRLLTLTTIKY